MLTGLLSVLILGTVAGWTDSAVLRHDEADRIRDRSGLVSRLAQWASIVDSPAATQAAVDRTPFPRQPQPLDPARDPARDAGLLTQLLVTPGGDATRVVALLDPAGRTLASAPAGHPIDMADLGPAWAAGWSGRAAMSPVFTFEGAPARATVVPVHRPQPWGVLVSISDEASGIQLFNGMAALLGVGSGSVSTVDPLGVPIASTEPGMVGRPVLSAAELRLSQDVTDGTRIWRTTESHRTFTNITALQPATGYLTYFRQDSESLNADLRAGRDQRNLTLLAVALAATLSIVAVGLRRETVARRSRAELRALFAAAHDIVLTADADGLVTFVSPAVTTLLGRHRSSLTGHPVWNLVHPGDTARLDRLITNPAAGSLLNVRLLSASGDPSWFDVAARTLATRSGNPEVLITCHAVGRRKSLLDQLGYQAGHDPLTGLPNRATFQERLAAALDDDAGRRTAGRGPDARADAGAGLDAGPSPKVDVGVDDPAPGGVAVLYIDLDGFKPVNDTLGHAAGDHVLRIVGQRLGALLGPDDVGGRFGGDEFGILLRHTDTDAADAAARRVIQVVAEPIVLDGAGIRVSASVGVAFAVAGLRHPGGLLRAADQAMYRAKQAGPGRFSVAVPTTTAPTTDITLPPGPRRVSDPPAPRPTPEPAPAPAGTTSDRDRPVGPATRRAPARRVTVRQRLNRAVPLFVLGAVILTTAAVALEIENSHRHRADEQRIASGQELVRRLAAYTGDLTEPLRLIDPVSRYPWSLTDAAADRQVLSSISRSALGGPGAVVALVDLDGNPEAIEPAGASLPFPPRHEIWTRARDTGRSAPVVNADGETRAYSVIPIVRDGHTAAFLVTGRLLTSMPGAEMIRALCGPWPDEPGGNPWGRFWVVDDDGRVALANDPSFLGRPVIDRSDLASIPSGQSREVTLHDGSGHDGSGHDGSGHDGSGEVGTAAPIPGLLGRGFLVLQQRAASADGGPEAGDPTSDLLLLGIIGVTFTGLARATRRGEQAVRREEERLHTLLHEAHDIIVNLDRAGRSTFISSAIESLLGYPVDAWLGRPITELLHPEDRDPMRAFIAGRPSGRGPSLLDMRMRTVGGDYRWFDVEAGPSAGGTAAADSGVLLTCHEVSERRHLQEQLRQRARHDPLTGLPNRAALAEHLELLARDHIPFAILLIDLDDFKPINDTFGHQTGDDVLRTVAIRLTAALPDGQPGANSGRAFRLGGDEFVVVLPEADASTMRRASARIRALVQAPVDVAGSTVTVGATIGLASSRSIAGAPPHSPEHVVWHADADMYEAKRAARAGRSVSPAGR